MSEKHLQRYVNEFSGRHDIREADTADQMSAVAAGMVGKRISYRETGRLEEEKMASGIQYLLVAIIAVLLMVVVAQCVFT